MKDVIAVVLPIVTLLIGWILNELHQANLSRQDFKSAVRKALSYLLEIRFQFQAVEFLLGELKLHIPEADTHLPQLRTLLEYVLGSEEQMDRRYTAAVDAIAARNPFLAYELAARNRVGHFFRVWRQWATSAGAAPAALEGIESELRKIVGPKFDEIIVSVAQSISLRTKVKARRLLSREFELPEELAQVLEGVRATSDEPIPADEESAH